MSTDEPERINDPPTTSELILARKDGVLRSAQREGGQADELHVNRCAEPEFVELRDGGPRAQTDATRHLR